MRAVLNREIVARLRVDDEGGRLTDADTLPTVIVIDGDAVPVAGSVVAHENIGVYTATIPARTRVDRLAVTWAFQVGGFARTVATPVEVIAERLVPLWQYREDEVLADLPTPLLLRVADTVEEWFRNALKFPPVVEAWRGSWQEPYPTRRLRVPGVSYPQALYALAVGTGAGFTTYTPSQLAVLRIQDTGIEKTGGGVGFLEGNGRAWSFPDGTYTAYLSHGLSDPGDDLRRAATILGRYTARVSNLPERARRILTAETEIDLSMPSPDRPTGLPDVDAVIGRYRLQAL